MRLLILLLLAAVACGDSGVEPPDCPTDLGPIVGSPGSRTAVCSGGCTHVHGAGECPTGYTCTCSGTCVWFESFPLDAGAGCGPLDAGIDAAVPPPCPLDGGTQVMGPPGQESAVCGGGCTRVHEEGECPAGYTCTCSGMCIWFEVFPQDAGVARCGDGGV